MAANGLYEEILIAGFGGQGIIMAGKLLACTAMNAGKNVTFMPSYGAEVRGGTANCMVIIADEPVASPLVNKPDSLIAMNKVSLDKFAVCLKKGGLFIYNSSLIDEQVQLPGTIEAAAVPADKIALELGNKKTANMVAVGAYLQKRGIFSADEAAKSLKSVLPKRYHDTIPLNAQALLRGAEFIKNGK